MPSDENKWTAICEAQVTLFGPEPGMENTFCDIGDANPANVSRNIAPHIIRMASTRAKARALRDAVNIGAVAIEELDESEALASAASKETETKPSATPTPTGAELRAPTRPQTTTAFPQGKPVAAHVAAPEPDPFDAAYQNAKTNPHQTRGNGSAAVATASPPVPAAVPGGAYEITAKGLDLALEHLSQTAMNAKIPGKEIHAMKQKCKAEPDLPHKIGMAEQIIQAIAMGEIKP